MLHTRKSWMEILSKSSPGTTTNGAIRAGAWICFVCWSKRDYRRVPKLSIKDLDIKGKRVLIRVDFNVPLKDGQIGDDTRLRASLPTVQFALDAGATVVLASHLGRPKGKKNPQLSLLPVGNRFAELLGRPVAFVDDCIGDEV